MSATLQIDDDIKTFVDAGEMKIGNYEFCSSTLREKYEKAQGNGSRVRMAAAMGAAEEEAGDTEQPVKFRMNRTGNILYSSSSDQLNKETRDLFDSVTVLMAAMTKAMADSKKSLFDYGAWSSMIGKSGYFVEVQKFKKHLTIRTGSVTIDTQIITQLIPGLTTSSSLEIAKDILSSLGGEYSASSTQEDTKLGHILFICEELFGAPSVTVRLFFATKKSHDFITKSPCHSSAQKQIEQDQEANTFLFVSPETVSKFAGQFAEQPEEYLQLIERLKKNIETP